MCFVLYLAARVAPPITSYGGRGGQGTVSTDVLKEHDSAVRRHFTLPHVVYVGSDQGCGCGFRNTSFQGFWPDDVNVPFTPPDPNPNQPNHESLAGLLREHFGREDFIEFYGCWAGDTALTEIDRRELTLADIRNPAFHFHQRGFCRVTLAGALDAPGKIPETEAEHRALLASQERLLGPEHPDVLKTRHNLAERLALSGKLPEAEQEYRVLLAIRERVLGPEHPDTLGIRHNLAGTLSTQGKHAEAEGLFRQAIPSFERVLGPEHCDTQRARAGLAAVLQAQAKLTSDINSQP